MNSILKKIVDEIEPQLRARESEIPLVELKEQVKKLKPCRDFAGAFLNQNSPRIIAELKKASPSKGLIRQEFDYRKLALELEAAGAAALSVLTEENYFLGSLRYLKEISEIVKIPVLRKDFIFTFYQVYEARANGADAILLIAALLPLQLLSDLTLVAESLGMTVLGEAHNEEELENLVKSKIKLIGINARNLNTFSTNLDTAAKLIAQVPYDRIAIAESAITSRNDVQVLSKAGARGFLIGETLMRAEHPGEKLKELLG